MRKNNHKQIVYHTNRAILAFVGQRADNLANHCAVLGGFPPDTSLHSAYLLYVKALSARLAHEPSACTDLLAQAYHEFTEAGEKQGAGVMLLDLRNTGHPTLSSMDSAKKALALFATIGDETGRSKALHNIGTCQRDNQEFGDACQSFQKALSIHRQRDDYFSLGITLTNLASCFLDTGDYANALLHAEQAVDCLEDTQRNPEKQQDSLWLTTGWTMVPARCEPHLANACINHGNALKALGQYDTAIEQYSKTLTLVRQAGNKRGEAIALNQIGETLRVKGDFPNAEDFFRQGKDLFEQSGTRGYMYAVSLQSVGEACWAQGRYMETMELYEKALEEFRAVGNRVGEAEVLVLLGELYTTRKNYKKAVVLLNEGLELAQSISITENIVRANRAMGSALMHLDSGRAREYFSRALLVAEETDMMFEQQNIHRDLFRYYKFMGDNTQALSHHERHHDLRESLFTRESDQKLKNLQILYGVEKYKQSLAESRNKIRQLEIELNAKTNQLSGVASRIVEKQEFIDMTEHGLNKILAAHPDEKDERALELLRLIRSDHTVKRDWEEFTNQFMSVHREYAERLMALAPDMSPAEMKVCVLLRLSMNTKQIADVLNLSNRSIDNHRLRIRKKLHIADRENLFTFLMSLDTTPPEPGQLQQ